MVSGTLWNRQILDRSASNRSVIDSGDWLPNFSVIRSSPGSQWRNYDYHWTPKVEKIKTGGVEKIVTVGYISPATNWNDDASGAVSKYVDYIFQKQGSEYYLVAVRESAMQVELSADNSQTEAQ